MTILGLYALFPRVGFATFSTNGFYVSSGDPNGKSVCGIADSESAGAKLLGNSAGLCVQTNGGRRLRWLNAVVGLITAEGTYNNTFQGLAAQNGGSIVLEGDASETLTHRRWVDRKTESYQRTYDNTGFRIYSGIPNSDGSVKYAVYADGVLSSDASKRAMVLINAKGYTPQIYLGESSDVGVYAGNQGYVPMNGVIMTSYDTSATALQAETKGNITITGLVRFAGKTSVDSAGTDEENLGTINLNTQPSSYSADPVNNSVLIFTGDSSLTNLNAYQTAIYLSTPYDVATTNYRSPTGSVSTNTTTNNVYYTATGDTSGFTGNTLTIYGNYASTTSTVDAIDLASLYTSLQATGINISKSYFQLNNSGKSIVSYPLTVDSSKYTTALANTTLYFQTVLGDDNSATDKLVVKGNTSGNTNIQVTNVGGEGAITTKGINIIEVDGNSDGVFTLTSRVVAGAYEYWLQKADENADSYFGYTEDDYGNWYLVNTTSASRGGTSSGTPIDRPETGSYLSAHYLSNSLFVTRLWDRTGYSRRSYMKKDRYGMLNREMKFNQYANDLASYQCRYRFETVDDKGYPTDPGIAVTIYQKRENEYQRMAQLANCLDQNYARHFDTRRGLWAHYTRNEGSFKNRSDQVKTNTYSYALHAGGDVLSFTTNDKNNIDVGVMAAFGEASSSSYSDITGYRSRLRTKGWALGLYGTYYSDWLEKRGTYIDTWLMFNRYRNRVYGEGLATQQYDAQGITASVEVGHNFLLDQKDYRDNQHTLQSGDMVRRDWFLQPQAQLVYLGVGSKELTEASGTKVKADHHNWLARLSVRTSLRYYEQYYQNEQKNSSYHYRVTEPYIEAGILHYIRDFAVDMGDTQVSSDTLRTIGELKAGIKREWSDRSYLWTDVAVQFGKNSYRNYQWMLGVSYKFH
ncbi:hypothetical protein IX83_01535 [Basilea psittacipulmonis DSM 24701]|uniref:Autotransporter domain-containing protein n=2 Tax=Basilea TaxID=1472344 RepID=A0A077DBE0_9BURK|nr:hypothetical protein IX83_01535 [Basilea psittacipulmonis DSM 24701]